MSKASFTPGPWRVYQGWVHPNFSGPGPQTTNGDTAICEPLGPDKDANARLIASTPDLHNALIDLLRVTEHMGARLSGTGYHFEDCQIALTNARAALARSGASQ